MNYGINSSRFKQIEIEFEQELKRRRNNPPTADASDGFVHPKMPEPLPHCPQCGTAVAPGAKRCMRYGTSLVRK